MRTHTIRDFIDDLPPTGKFLPAVAIAAYVALAVAVLPSFTPQTGTNLVTKSDRLQVASANPVCAQQNWPNIDPSCLKATRASGSLDQVRLVTTDRRN
jgi:hypothetical protein